MPVVYALVHKDRDSAFGIAFPDLPGCFSAADQQHDLFAEAKEALELYFAGTAVVCQRSIEALMADAEIKEELSAGAFLIAVECSADLALASAAIEIEPDQGKASLESQVPEKVAIRSLGEFRMRSDRSMVSRGHHEKTSPKVASAAAKVLKSKSASKAEKSAAASALTQKGSNEKTSAKAASTAAKVLRDPKASKDAKTAAASALTQKSKK